MAGLRDQELSLVSHPSLGEGQSRWVEDVVNCASELDNYWGGGAKKLAALPESDFEPPPRFEDLKPIGRGGMGVVYSALDKTTSEPVAIKVAKSRGGDSESIKREFRTLAKIRHPNLVVLKGLHQFNEIVFISMEFIHGERFNTESATGKKKGLPWQQSQLSSLCDRLLQLVDGIDFLHRSGFVHCDIKPSNVLVTDRDRVVVLDLGLAQPLHQRRRQNKCFGGTSAYMSPEQASGESLLPASDWFAFGVVMFETLFGYRPFQGACVDVLFDKLSGNPNAAPGYEETGVAQSLSNLCIDLLDPTPSERPSVEKIRRCLARFSSQPDFSIEPRSPQPHFFGREKELSVLETALVDTADASEPTLLLVEGESGIGKTQLIQKFLEDYRCSSEMIVLSGRCYENERIPYKAIDAVIGELATQWRLLESDAVSAELINSIGVVFNGFSGFANDSKSSEEVSSVPQTAADGLHSILDTFFSREKRVIIFIDDIQWADADSGQLLSKMIAGLPILLICSHRPLEHSNQFLENLTAGFPTADADQNFRRITVSPFNDEDAQQFLGQSYPDLSKQLLGKAIGASAGVPMFLTSVAQQFCTSPADQVESNALNWTRDLAPNAKRLLEFVCASGYPMPRSIALEAAQISRDFEACISALSSRRLVTLSQSDGEVMLTPFHDMIRETVYSKLSALEKKATHSSIAATSENKPGVAPDRLAFHFREAGDSAKFCRYSILSGDVAADSQAFDEAVRAYSEAFGNFFGTDDEKKELKQKLASSLAGLGRASDAGDMYFELAAQGDGGAAQFLQMAAFQYCFAGRIEEALLGFNRLLKPWGYTTFKSERSVFLRLAMLRTKLRISGFTDSLKNRLPFFHRRSKVSPDSKTPAAPIAAPSGSTSSKNNDPSEAIRMTQLCDLLWDTAIAISAFDYIQAALFVNYSLQVAVSQNDEVRILRATLLWATGESAVGARKEKSIRELFDSTDTDTTRNNPYLAGAHLKGRGFLACSNGNWEEAIFYFSKAYDHFREHCPDLLEEIGASQLWGLLALQSSGQVKASVARYQELLAIPDNREHRLNISNLLAFCGPFACLSNDRPVEALTSIDEGMKMWPVDRFCLQHIVSEQGRADVNLYRGDYREAFESAEKMWEAFGRSNHGHIECMRILIWECRGRCAVSRFETADGRIAERIARRSIKKLQREKASWARPMAQRVVACLALKKQNYDTAKIALLAARDGFEQSKMRLFQYTAEAKLCEISGKLETPRFQVVKDWFDSQEIKNPQAIVGMHYPVETENSGESSASG